jgi:hypothetical protein
MPEVYVVAYEDCDGGYAAVFSRYDWACQYADQLNADDRFDDRYAQVFMTSIDQHIDLIKDRNP